jgi:hypothetical protein
LLDRAARVKLGQRLDASSDKMCPCSSARIREKVNPVACALLVSALCAIATGCSKGKHSEHATEMRSPEPAPPTPDTTPVVVLRTPAGLVLGIEGTPAPAAPTPATTGAVPQTTTRPQP